MADKGKKIFRDKGGQISEEDRQALKSELGDALKAEGMTLEEWIERGREIRGKIIEEKYGLREER